jgi:uncharacterized protein (DUF1778 family)
MFEGHAPLLSQCEKIAVEAVEGEQMLELQDRSETHLLNVLGFAPKARGAMERVAFTMEGAKPRLCPRVGRHHAYPRG